MNRLSQHTMIGLVACGEGEDESLAGARQLSRRRRAVLLVMVALTSWLVLAEAAILVGGRILAA